MEEVLKLLRARYVISAFSEKQLHEYLQNDYRYKNFLESLIEVLDKNINFRFCIYQNLAYLFEEIKKHDSSSDKYLLDIEQSLIHIIKITLEEVLEEVNINDNRLYKNPKRPIGEDNMKIENTINSLENLKSQSMYMMLSDVPEVLLKGKTFEEVVLDDYANLIKIYEMCSLEKEKDVFSEMTSFLITFKYLLDRNYLSMLTDEERELLVSIVELVDCDNFDKKIDCIKCNRFRRKVLKQYKVKYDNKEIEKKKTM